MQKSLDKVAHMFADHFSHNARPQHLFITEFSDQCHFSIRFHLFLDQFVAFNCEDISDTPAVDCHIFCLLSKNEPLLVCLKRYYGVQSVLIFTKFHNLSRRWNRICQFSVDKVQA